MSGTAVAGSYRTLIAKPVVARTFVLALVGRLGYAVLPLTFLFTVRQSTDSFATAAAAMAVFGSTTLVMPVQARLADRHGQRVVLTCVAAGFVLVLGAGLGALAAAGLGAIASQFVPFTLTLTGTLVPFVALIVMGMVGATAALARIVSIDPQSALATAR